MIGFIAIYLIKSLKDISFFAMSNISGNYMENYIKNHCVKRYDRNDKKLCPFLAALPVVAPESFMGNALPQYKLYLTE